MEKPDIPWISPEDLKINDKRLYKPRPKKGKTDAVYPPSRQTSVERGLLPNQRAVD